MSYKSLYNENSFVGDSITTAIINTETLVLNATENQLTLHQTIISDEENSVPRVGRIPDTNGEDFEFVITAQDIDQEIGGVISFSEEIKVNLINEFSADVGVTVEGVTHKDSAVTAVRAELTDSLDQLVLGNTTICDLNTTIRTITLPDTTGPCMFVTTEADDEQVINSDLSITGHTEFTDSVDILKTTNQMVLYKTIINAPDTEIRILTIPNSGNSNIILSSANSGQTISTALTLSNYGAGVLKSSSGGVLSSSAITNSDIDASAAISDTKLATISTIGKVSNSSTSATSSNTVSAIVSRDSSGDFTAGVITCSAANTRRMGSGTVTIPFDSVGCGDDALNSLTTGVRNTALGYSAGISTNTGTRNTLVGYVSGYNNEDGSNNVAIGNFSLKENVSGNHNVAIGDNACARSSGSNNIVIGSNSYSGTGAGGSDNIICGYYVGNNYTSTESNNILIGNAGASSDSGAIKIGTAGTHTSVTLPTLNSTGIVHTTSAGLLSSSLIVNADIHSSAAITDTKLATISSAGKVSNSATSASSSNTFSAIVARDSSGNFTANTITATTFSGDLNGTINTATTGATQSAGDNSTKIATTAYVDNTVKSPWIDIEMLSFKNTGSSYYTTFDFANRYPYYSMQSYCNTNSTPATATNGYGFTPSNGNTWTCNQFHIKAGTYVLYVVGVGQNNLGKYDVTPSGYSALACDWYNSSATGVFKVFSQSYTITSDTNMTVELKCTGKNASSSSYHFAIQKMTFIQS